MKGLTTNCLGPGHKEEAHALVKKGLAMNFTSHVCWHVYGLLFRSERNYKEAIKCYVNALKYDKENMQILTDLSLLQIQCRMLPDYAETRRKILKIKSSSRNHWIAYAIGHHLTGNYKKALEIIDT